MTYNSAVHLDQMVCRKRGRLGLDPIYDGNAILAETIKNGQAATIHNSFLEIQKVLKARGNNPKVYIMENDFSSDLKEDMKKQEIDFQLDPRHMHRQNAAERAIITYKNHFISGLLATDPYLPISEWDRLLSQCVITLNLLQNSRLNQDLSAYAYLFGPYYFNKYPMAPPGNRLIVHDKPDNRT